MYVQDQTGLLSVPQGRECAVGRVVQLLALLFGASLAVFVVVQSVELQLEQCRVGTYSTKHLVLLALTMAALCTVLWAVGKLRWRERTLLLIALSVCAAVRVGYMLAIQTPIRSDFRLLYEAARGVLAGDMSWTETEYFRWWGYQIPFVAYEALVLKLFGSVWALKVFNVVFMVGVDWLIYRIARSFAGERAAFAAALLYAVYPEAVHMVTVLTNQHISAFFLLLGVWLLLTRRGWRWMAAAGASLAAGNLMRPEGMVFLAALVCCGICLVLRRPRRETAARTAAGVGLVLAVYWALQAAAGAALTASGLAPHGVDNTRPEWKFVVGLDARNAGGYSEDNLFILEIEDDQARREAVRAALEESFRECGDVPGFFLSKTRTMWAMEESFYLSSEHLDDSARVLFGLTVSQCLTMMGITEKGIALVLWMAVPTAAWLIWKRGGQLDAGAFFALVALCGFFCAFLIIEVQSRYRYVVMPLLFLLLTVPLDAWYTGGEDHCFIRLRKRGFGGTQSGRETKDRQA